MIAIAGLIPLAMLAGLIAGIAALSKRNDEEPPDGLVRRLVVAAITFGLTVVTVVGVGMLLDILFAEAGDFARELTKAFRGSVTYAWSDRDGSLLATWQRAVDDEATARRR